MSADLNKEDWNQRPQVRIQNLYSDYDPPFDAGAVVARLIEAVPSSYLRRLDAVVLTNSASFSRHRRRMKIRRRKRKVKVARALGLYHHESQGKPAWIEIVVDRIVGEQESSLVWKIPLAREVLVGEVLYHELGHHRHVILQPEFREREDVADDWSKQLLAGYFRRNYQYLRPFLWLPRVLLRVGRAVGFISAQN